MPIPPYSREDTERVPRRVLEGGVAVHGADSQEVQGGMVGREEDGEGVLLWDIGLESESESENCRLID